MRHHLWWFGLQDQVNDRSPDGEELQAEQCKTMNPFSNTQFLLYMETLHDRDENVESLLGISMCTSLVSGGALLVGLAQRTIWFHKNKTSSLSVTTIMSGAHHFETAEWEIQQKLDHRSIKICLISANNKITWIIQIDQELQ